MYTSLLPYTQVYIFTSFTSLLPPTHTSLLSPTHVYIYTSFYSYTRIPTPPYLTYVSRKTRSQLFRTGSPYPWEDWKDYRLTSWTNGPVGTVPDEVLFNSKLVPEHSSQLLLLILLVDHERKRVRTSQWCETSGPGIENPKVPISNRNEDTSTQRLLRLWLIPCSTGPVSSRSD